jgi:dihydrofolate reductase
MGKLVVSEFISLDGVIEDPGGGESTDFGGWTFQFPAPEGQVVKWEELVAADAQLLGRVTYEGFAEAWPAMAEVTGEFGAKMNGMPKFVVSTTLDTATWNNSTVVNGDLAEIVADLKARFSGDILVSGSATLVDELRALDVVDEYRLAIYPIVLGQGKKLFKDGALPTTLALAESRSLGPDVLLHVYRPVR